MSRARNVLVAGTVALLSACADERAVVVDVTVLGQGDRLCLVAFGDGEAVFERAYGGEDGPPTSGSLTLVAGDRVADRVRVSGWLGRGGRVVARGTGESGFGQLDEVHLGLLVTRCTPRGGDGPHSLAPVGAIDAAADATLVAIDLDGDGREELITVDADGALVAVHRAAGEGALETLEVPLPEGARPATAALLGDGCTQDLLLAAPGGAVVVASPGNEPETLAPVGPPATAVALGDLGFGEETLAVAGSDGVVVVGRSSGRTATLAAGPHGAVAVADLTGDGLDDLIASGDGGARVWLGSGSGPAEVPGALPASFGTVTGPLAVGDLDADGALDLVGAAGDTVRVARNRGDGLLEDRSGASPVTAASPIVRLILADLTGDCRDDLVVLDADGALAVYRVDAALRLAPISLSVGATRDVVAIDVDGDGALELAILEHTGAISVWGR